MRALEFTLLSGLVASLWLTASGCTEEEKGTCAAVEDEASGQWVVAHPETGLAWLRCPIGQTFDPDSCSCEGEPSLMNLNDAMEACPAGFVFPSDEDMVSVICNLHDTVSFECPDVVYDSCGECSICYGMFGDDQGRYPSSDLEPTDEPGWEGWTASIWDFGMACHYWSWYGETEQVWFNVRCVKDFIAGGDL